MLKNAPNPFGVLASKGKHQSNFEFHFYTFSTCQYRYPYLLPQATGEPPLCMSCSVLFALRNAITSARKDAGNNEWFQMGTQQFTEQCIR